MKKTFLILSVIGVVIAVWGVVLAASYNNQVTIVKLYRVITDTPQLQDKDCHVLVKNSDGISTEIVSPSSYCVSLQVGQRVTIQNGEIQR